MSRSHVLMHVMLHGVFECQKQGTIYIHIMLMFTSDEYTPYYVNVGCPPLLALKNSMQHNLHQHM